MDQKELESNFLDHLDKTIKPVRISLVLIVVMGAIAISGGWYKFQLEQDKRDEVVTTLAQSQRDDMKARENLTSAVNTLNETLIRMGQRQDDADKMIKQLSDKVFK